jgi:hypothetical protein
LTASLPSLLVVRVPSQLYNFRTARFSFDQPPQICHRSFQIAPLLSQSTSLIAQTKQSLRNVLAKRGQAERLGLERSGML